MGIDTHKNKKDYLYALLSGVLLALAFPPMPFGLLAFIGFVPLFKVLEKRNWNSWFLLSYLTIFIYNGLSNWWVGSWSAEADPFLMASGVAVCLGHPLFFMIPFWIFSIIRKKIGPAKAYWLFPFAWVAFEYGRGIGDLAYPWLSIGYTQMSNIVWVQAADVIGVYGLGFLIVLINIVIFKSLGIIKEHKDRTGVGVGYFKEPRSRNLFIVAILLFLIPFVYGAYKIQNYDYDKLMSQNPSIKVGIIQANVDPWDKWGGKAADMIFRHLHLQDSLLKAVGPLDLVVWSETAITYMNLDFNSRHNFKLMTDKIDYSNTALLTGFTDIYFYNDKKSAPSTSRDFMGDTGRQYDAFNSALMLLPKPYDSINPQIYHKSKLTPFSERLPFLELISFAKSWFEWKVGISSWQKGDKQNTLNMVVGKDSARVAAIICIESIFPDFVRNYSNANSNLFTIITNDGWFDHTPGPRQHYFIACMRAIENRRYIARCANTGVSGFIQPNGQTLFELEEYKSIGGAAKLPLMEEKTFYVKYGDIIPKLSVLLILLLLGYCLIPTKKRAVIE